MNFESGLMNSLPGLSIALVSLAGGWFVTQRLTYKWAIRQRKRESLLAATTQLYSAYGEFFVVWKLWNRLDKSEPTFDEKRWELLKRAANAEASTESIILKIVTEFPVSSAEVDDLGRFRQAFQSLREVMRNNAQLDWSQSEAPPYVAFKRLSCRVATLLQTGHEAKPPGWEEAAANHLVATSNRWENNWF